MAATYEGTESFSFTLSNTGLMGGLMTGYQIWDIKSQDRNTYCSQVNLQ